MRRQQHATPSKESDYRCRQQGHHWPPGAPQIPASSLDMPDALVIDRAVSALPLRYNVVLRAKYLGRHDSSSPRMLSLAERVGFKSPTYADVDAMIAMGKSMLARQLVPTIAVHVEITLRMVA